MFSWLRDLKVDAPEIDAGSLCTVGTVLAIPILWLGFKTGAIVGTAKFICAVICWIMIHFLGFTPVEPYHYGS